MRRNIVLMMLAILREEPAALIHSIYPPVLCHTIKTFVSHSSLSHQLNFTT